MQGYFGDRYFYARMSKVGAEGVLARLGEIECLDLRARVANVVWWDLCDLPGDWMSPGWMELKNHRVVRGVPHSDVIRELERVGYSRARAEYRMRLNSVCSDTVYRDLDSTESGPDRLKGGMVRRRTARSVERPEREVPLNYEDQAKREMREMGLDAVDEVVEKAAGVIE